MDSKLSCTYFSNEIMASSAAPSVRTPKSAPGLLLNTDSPLRTLATTLLMGLGAFTQTMPIGCLTVRAHNSDSSVDILQDIHFERNLTLEMKGYRLSALRFAN